MKKGKYIYVDFPDKDMLPKKIDNSDVKVNGSKADDVRITDSDSIRIEIPKGADGDDYIKLEFSSSAEIRNPSSAGSKYTYKVSYNDRDYESKNL